MKFNLKTSGYYYSKEEAESLEKLGFKMTCKRHKGTGFETCELRNNKRNNNVTIDINTLEELLEFEWTWGPLIIKGDTITIYDDYIE